MTVETAPGQKLYRAVVDALRREIETGRFAETQLLPAERVLCELLDVSRTTLRHAIADLLPKACSITATAQAPSSVARRRASTSPCRV